MNLLTINTSDCSADISGGVNQVTVALTRYFTHQLGIACYIGFFQELPSGKCRLPEIKDGILLNRQLDEEAFEHFLLRNKIDIVQVNYLRKEKIYVMRDIYRVAHRNGVKVIHAFHMAPLFQAGVYASWDKVWYSICHRERVWENFKFCMYDTFKSALNPIIMHILRPTYRMQWESCDKLVTLSPRYIQPFMQIAGVDDASKFTAIGNELRYNIYLTEQELEQKEKIVLVLQRMSEDTKRVSLSLRAWRRIEQSGRFLDWRMQVVGDGKDEMYYRHLLCKWKLKRAECTGRQEPLEYMKKASLFLIASATEGWPMVLMEASQMGLPMIAMDSYGAVHDIISEDYNGKIVANGDIGAFYKAMVELMEDDTKRMQMARNAVESSKRFEVAKVAAKWQALFDELMRTSNESFHHHDHIQC